MNERNRRGGRGRDEREWRGSYDASNEQRQPGRDRYPDESYGGHPGNMAGGWQRHRGRGWQGNQNWDAEERRGADYRDDFGPGRQRDRHQGWGGDQSHERDSGGFNEERWRASDNYSGPSFGFGQEERVERGGSYGYGSPYGVGDMNSNRPGRGDWRDSDWMPNRPTRGRGTWAGDWALSNADSAENYAGRGPKDYRRSDDRIREDVCDRFTDDPAVDASEIAVRVENGDVTLMGTVASREQKRRAEDLVERVTGVRDVSNQLRVNRADTTTTTTSASGQTTGRTRGGAGGSGVAADRGREERS